MRYSQLLSDLCGIFGYKIRIIHKINFLDFIKKYDKI